VINFAFFFVCLLISGVIIERERVKLLFFTKYIPKKKTNLTLRFSFPFLIYLIYLEFIINSSFFYILNFQNSFWNYTTI